MTYRIEFRPAAFKSLRSLDSLAYRRIRKAIDSLAEDPRPKGCTKLTGMDAWRVRVGQYRIIYTITDSELLVLVVKIGHRKEIYRKLS